MLYGLMKPVGLNTQMITKVSMVNIRLHTLWCSFVRTMQRAAFTILSVSKLISNGASKRVFHDSWSENAEFVRYGVMHRNPIWISEPARTDFSCSKKTAKFSLQVRSTGVEGYVESAASGLVAGINAARLFKEEANLFPEQRLSVVYRIISPMLTASTSNR